MENLKKLRLEIGYSQDKMAAVFHMATNTYRNYEKNIRQPSRDALISFADYFHVSIDFLLGHTTVRFPIDENKNLLNEKEEQFILAMRELPEAVKEVVYNFATDLTDAVKKVR